MRTLLYPFLLLFSLHPFAILGQSLGQWNSHYSYAHALSLSETSSAVYCATEGGFFYITKEDFSLHPFSKVEGLSDHGVVVAAYAPAVEKMIIAYANANLDIVCSDGIHNMNDILRKPMTGEKTIHNIFIVGEYAYLSCSFGIVVVDLKKEEIKDTYYIGENGNPLNINDLTIFADTFYAATDAGLYSAPKDAPDLVWYGAWKKVTSLPTPSAHIHTVASFGSYLFTGIHSSTSETDTAFYMEQGTWHSFFTQPGMRIDKIRSNKTRLLLAAGGQLFVYDQNISLVKHVKEYGFGSSAIRDALYDQNGTLWLADRDAGLIYSNDGNTYHGATPAGPYYSTVFSIHAWSGALAITGGGYDASWTPLYSPAMLFLMEEEHWTDFIRYDLHDIVRVIPDPVDPTKLFLASWNDGIIVLKDHQIETIYNETNSSLQSILPGQSLVRVGGMTFDRDHRLWVTNSSVQEPVSFMTPDGQWQSLPYGKYLHDMTLGDILIDHNNYKWILLPRGNGLFVFDDRHTPGDPSDDRAKRMPVIDQEGNAHNQLYCFTCDHNGYIWVGTDQGPMVYYNPYYVFEQAILPVQRIKIPRNDGSGLADYLLGTELVTAIAVDGADRKWIGTRRSGAFLVSPDGLHIIRHFSAADSPLPSNNILGIAIDPESGIVHFGTDNGVVSFHGSATAPNENLSHIKVYPNPVRENFSETVVISGLTENAYVTITDIAGNLVFSTTSLGGQALWNIKNLSGQRVSSGVYLVFITDSMGEKVKVAKILVIR